MPKIGIRNCAAAACGCIMLATTMGFAADKGVSIKTISRIKKSVVPIVCVDRSDTGGVRVVGILGSGFFVDSSGRFLTAAHVLDGYPVLIKQRRPCTSAIYIPNSGWGRFEPSINFQSFNFISCASDKALDLAVCTPIENPFASKRVSRTHIEPIEFDTGERVDGANCAFTGFPLENVAPITSTGRISGKVQADAGSGFDYVIDKAAWPGASGSLVYVEGGRVIGIVLKRGQNEGAGLGYARSASIIVDFLSKHPVAKQEATRKK